MLVTSLCLAFDGVIHADCEGPDPAAFPHRIEGPPVPGAIDFLLASARAMPTAIYSHRLDGSGVERAKGLYAIRRWLVENGVPEEVISLGDEHPRIGIVALRLGPSAGSAVIDAGAVPFDGTFPPGRLAHFEGQAEPGPP